MRRLLPGILLVAVATSLAGCNNDNNTTVTTPTTTTTTAPTVTETFTGTLNMNGGATFSFTATAAGTVTLTLTSLSGGEATLPIGLSLGTWTGSACQIVIANDAAAQTAVVTGTVTSAASLCARVYDTGKVTTPVDFNVTIAHP